MSKIILSKLNPFRSRRKQRISKRNKIKNGISSIVKFRIVKRSTLTKVRTRIVLLLGSTMLIINIVFTVCPPSPAYAAPAESNRSTIIACTRDDIRGKRKSRENESEKVYVFTQRDILLENKFDSVAEKVGTKDVSVINQNILIDYITERAKIVEKRVKARTEELQKITDSKKSKQSKGKIRTLSDLPKQVGDPITSKEFESILSYNTDINQKKLRQKFFNSEGKSNNSKTEQVKSAKQQKKHTKWNTKIHTLADLEKE